LSGLLEQEHFELVEGTLIDRSGRKRPELNAQHSLYLWLQHVFGFRFVLQNEPIYVAPADNAINEPVPEIVVINREFQTFVSDNPGPADVHLIVEVSRSTFPFDLTTKAALYARAGIAEYWVLDVEGVRLIVHRNPNSGKYTTITAYEEHQSVAPLVAPEHEFPIRSAFF
jgi:Uma2 family endonuclease